MNPQVERLVEGIVRYAGTEEEACELLARIHSLLPFLPPDRLMGALEREYREYIGTGMVAGAAASFDLAMREGRPDLAMCSLADARGHLSRPSLYRLDRVLRAMGYVVEV